MWDSQRGRRGLAKLLEFAARCDGTAGGRICAVLGPEQVDTCSPELLERLASLTEEMNLTVTTHASQSKAEYEYIVGKYGLTPVEFLERVGLLGPRLIIAHCICDPCCRWKASERFISASVRALCSIASMNIVSRSSEVFTVSTSKRNLLRFFILGETSLGLAARFHLQTAA